MDSRYRAEASAGAPPRPPSETERMLLEIWSAVLRVDCLGVDDEFLAVGGDSLAAMRCINRVSTVFDVELPFEAFFLEPATVAAFAARLDGLRSERN
jgi:hypothetical protein